MARFSSGWFKCWREAARGDLPDNVYLFAIWHWLLHSATWKESSVLWNGSRRQMPPGCVVFGITELSEKWDCSRATIHKWLKYLHDTGRIVNETCTRGSFVTICNWDLYQNEKEVVLTDGEHEPNTNRTRTEHEVALSEERRKKKEEERSTDVEPKLTQENLTKEEGGSFGEDLRNKRPPVLTQYPPGFEEVYAAYPRKQGKKRGFALYKKSIKSPELRDALLLAIKHYSAFQTDPTYLMHFSTFMGSWEEWVDPETGTTQGTGPKLELKNIEEL